MTVTINGVIVTGTPEEISELLKLQDNKNYLNYPRINSPDIPDRTYTYTYPYWWCAPPYDWYGTGTEYLRRQPTCTSTTAQATSDGISMTTGENK